MIRLQTSFCKRHNAALSQLKSQIERESPLKIGLFGIDLGSAKKVNIRFEIIFKNWAGAPNPAAFLIACPCLASRTAAFLLHIAILNSQKFWVLLSQLVRRLLLTSNTPTEVSQ